MRINPSNSPAINGADIGATDQAKKNERVKKSGYDSAAATDSKSARSDSSSAEISSKAKDMAKATQIAKDSPDVREAKIAELRDKIQNKKYNVSASEIADKLVDDHIRLAGA